MMTSTIRIGTPPNKSTEQETCVEFVQGNSQDNINSTEKTNLR
jgi:hypothetical protein